MDFTVLPPRSRPTEGVVRKAFLVQDNWDDWAKYRTQFFLYVSDGNGALYEIGAVKIGQFGLLPSPTIKEGSRAPAIAPDFHALDDRFFSIGQDETYYEALNRLGAGLRT